VIRTLVVDDHPAVLAGLVGALRMEPGFVPVATATGAEAAMRQVGRSRPDIALVDYQLADGDGLTLCHELKLLTSPPRVLLYSGMAGADLAVAARVAGADGMLNKDAPLEQLFAAIRTVMRGGQVLPPLRPAASEAHIGRLDPDDLPILGMRMDGVPAKEIATVLRVDERDVSHRIVAMLRRLPPARGVGPAVIER
jgi:DNA-binding NarL/FixJ family response regulator